MYKVLIADDEPKVCKLIQNLVDWRELGLEIIDMANDGIIALEIIEEKQPDIVITDIRMPGYDGIELIKRAKELNPNIHFIIVSGYRHFDYAHNAIKYGVEDYLLKPLKEAELKQTLMKMLEKKDILIKEKNEKVDLKRIVNNDIKKIKQNLLERLRDTPNEGDMLENRQWINEEYHCQFIEGYYMGLIIVSDILTPSVTEEAYKLLNTKTREIAGNYLKSQFQELLITPTKEGCLVVVNGTEEQFQKLNKRLKKIRAEIMGLNDIFLDVKVTVGLGKRVTDMKEIYDSIQQAKKAVSNRILQGCGYIIEVDSVRESKYRVDDFINGSTRDLMLTSIDILDGENIRKTVMTIKGDVKETKMITGECIMSVCEELFNIFHFGIKKHYLSFLEKVEEAKYSQGMYRCSTVDDLFDYIINYFEIIIEQIKEEKKRMDTQPIRKVKKYIHAHYGSPVSLEEVSRLVGFNAAYFSALFKKETGQNFSEYLIQVRVKVAKGLLADTHKSILDVAEEVGYNDLKYFSKLFKKVTGLSPSEYRKLYY